MTVNYTTLLALGQPVTGTENGTWGDDVNNAITSYLDIAIAGTLNLTGASFTAGALTLANTQGTSTATNISSTTAQYAVLRTSSLSVNSTITAPSSSRIYLVDNADATYTVTIKASGQTGYTVATNTRAWVYFNGTDYVLASTNDITKLVGTLPVASGGTGATSLTADNVILGNGTSAVQFVAPGTNGNVLISNGTTWTSAALTGFVTLAANNAFTGANTFYNATGQTFGTATSTQDGIIVAGRAGGSSSYRVTLSPGTLTASRSVTFPDAAGAVVLDSATQTLTNKTTETLTLNKGFTEQVHTLGTSGSLALNPTNGSIQSCTLTGNPTFTDSLSAGQSITLLLVNGSSYTVTWPTITWVSSAGNVAPTLAANNTLVFWKISTTLYGAVVGKSA